MKGRSSQENRGSYQNRRQGDKGEEPALEIIIDFDASSKTVSWVSASGRKKKIREIAWGLGGRLVLPVYNTVMKSKTERQGRGGWGVGVKGMPRVCNKLVAESCPGKAVKGVGHSE